MNNKNGLILGIIAIGAIIAVKYMTASIVPYVPFEEARKKGEYVQIMGAVDRASVRAGKSGFQFVLIFEKEKIAVSHNGDKPSGFDDAEKVVAMGSFDSSTGLFIADKILTKCPTKYDKKSLPSR